MMSSKGLTLGEGLVIVAIVLVICSVAIPGLLSSQRASNERGASTSLKTLVSAEADFRANDRDGNGVNDFWTGDVKSLYTLNGRESESSSREVPIKLIDRTLAAADVDESVIPAGGKNNPLTAFAAPAPQAGYWFAALVADATEGASKAVPYKKDTGGKPSMGTCHHLDRFGFTAIPDSLSRGKYMFLVNENNTVIREALTTSVRRGTAAPPGIAGVDPCYLNWPDEPKYKRLTAID